MTAAWALENEALTRGTYQAPITLMWRRAIAAFLSSLLGVAVAITLLYLAFVYGYRVRVGEGIRMHVLMSAHIFAALSLAAAIWGSIVGGIKMGIHAGIISFVAFILSGIAAVALLLLALIFPRPDFLALWPITTLAGTIAGGIAGALIGWRLGGKRLLWRSALVSGIPAGLIFATPLTVFLLVYIQAATLLLLFIPFVVLTTYLGTVLPSPRPAALSSADSASL